jgi:hypothetical protein
MADQLTQQHDDIVARNRAQRAALAAEADRQARERNTARATAAAQAGSR